MTVEVRRLTAFTTDPNGGNRAGVWIGEQLPDPATMQAIAADVGYSETVFAAPVEGSRRTIRYYSPLKEITFCGHATIALGVALGEDNGKGNYTLDTAAGDVELAVTVTSDGPVAALTSVEPSYKSVSDELLSDVLDCLGWSDVELDCSIPPAIAYAGAHHLVIAVTDREVLRMLSYDFDQLQRLMLDADLTTLQLIWRQDAESFQARDPFPVGGVVEDPATGAAAAAFGGYLRSLDLLDPPARFVIHQGVDMGLPSRLEVTVPSSGGIIVSGRAVTLPAE